MKLLITSQATQVVKSSGRTLWSRNVLYSLQEKHSTFFFLERTESGTHTNYFNICFNFIIFKFTRKKLLIFAMRIKIKNNVTKSIIK